MATATKTRYRNMSRQELYDLAQEKDIEGRSQMSRDELAAALEREDTGPEAVALLRRQHDQIRALFEEFSGLSNRPSARKRDLVREMITQLVKHSEVEEQVLYPALRNELPDVEGQVLESLEEHHAAELLLAELDRLAPDHERFDAKVTVLIESVQHHIEEEESDLFPRIESSLDEQRGRELGQAMVKIWEVAPTRPHPRSPDEPPLNVVLGLGTAAWDLVVGTARWAGRRVRRT